MTNKWDIEADVVVVGYGLAGAISAIDAHDAGAKVLLTEKMSVPGGNSLLAGGSMVWSMNADDAARYLRACSDERVGQDIIDFMAKGMTEIPAYVNKLAEEVDAVTTTLDVPFLFYSFPGKESFRTLRVLGFKDQEDAKSS